ncbi:ABC transporter permease [Occallatibacter riparius]|uniref:ABC transporter permease n=1 Tax=Occallatibacter riparius TaxID=1002689 RepID=A0A9J7BUC5_9BACT|nr:ABC transporter permease [Occallatibacter riparius]UWZ84597.1 ABC transporter permease [Occallatibacter riparius]
MNARSAGFVVSLYRRLLRFFPHRFRCAFEHEMLETTEGAAASMRRQSLAGLVALFADLAAQLAVAHLREIAWDVRYELRLLIRKPAFTFVAVVSMSLAICAGSAFFSELNGTILRDVPGVGQADDLVTLQQPVSYPAYRRIRDQTNLFSSTAAYVAPVPFGVNSNGHTERIWGHIVTPTYFTTLGVTAELGRLLDAQDELARGTPSIVVSDRYWKSNLGSDPDVIGRPIHINGKQCTIVGVVPVGFQGASPMMYVADLWLPVPGGLAVAPELSDDALERPQVAMFQFIGRRRQGVKPSQIETALDAIQRQILRDSGQPAVESDRLVSVATGGKLIPTREKDRALFTFLPMVVISLLSLIACSNVVNMLLARSLDRRREVAVQLSLGASRARLIRQLIIESLLIASGAGTLGFALTCWLMHMLSQLRLPHAMPIRFNVEVDWRVLVFTIGLTALTGLAIGLLPAIQATRSELVPALKEGGNLQIRRRRAFSARNLLVVSQMAASLTLLLVIGYIVFGMERTMLHASGFDARNVQLVSIDPVRDGYSAEQAKELYPKLLEHVKGLPGFVSATWTEAIPMQPSGRVTFTTDTDGSRRVDQATEYIVGSGYFQTMGISIVRGRGLTSDDEKPGRHSIVVSEALAQSLSRTADPIGRRLTLVSKSGAAFGLFNGSAADYRMASRDETYEVVGVAADVLDTPIERPGPAIYLPMTQVDFARPTFQGITLATRTTPGVDAATIVRAQIAAIDPKLTTFNVKTMPDWIEQLMFIVKIGLWSYGLIGAFGLVLASVGLGGVTAYSVSSRMHEIGIRLALGARSRDILRMIMAEGAALISIGSCMGIALAVLAMHVMAASMDPVSRSIQHSQSDPRIAAGALGILFMVGLLACYLPARRSGRVDPVIPLRQE